MTTKKFLALSIFLFLFGQSGYSKNYYFSAYSGNDSRSVAQAQSPSTPWQTIAKLNSFFSNIKPGDSILFKKGEYFRGNIRVTKSGLPASPITISSYGTGATPILTLPKVTGWTYQNGVYSVKKTMWPTISIFYEDGLPVLNMASSAACTNGKWWCNSSKLYYKPASGSASNHTITVANIVEVGGYEPGIDLSNNSYITISGLEFKCFGTGVKTFETTAGTTGLTIANSIFEYCRTGVLMCPGAKNNTNATIQNSLFYRNQCGINMYTITSEGGNVGSTLGTHIGCKITGNEMSENGTVDGKAQWTYGTDYEAMGLQNFMNGTISNNYVHDGYQIGIIFYNMNTRSSDNNVISQNRIFNNGKGGLVLQGANNGEGASANYTFNNNFISNNLFVNSAFTAASAEGTVIIYQGSKTTKMNYFVNNTLCGSANIVTFPTSRSPFFTIENNIFYNPGKYNFISWFWVSKPASLVMNHNIYYQATGTNLGFVLNNSYSLAGIQAKGLELHSKTANPMLVNPVIVSPTVNDFHLKYGSPAINSGISVGLPFNGTSMYIGAFDYSAAAPSKPKITVITN